MRTFIFDTDIGGDCDDVVALTILVRAHQKKEIKLAGITCNFIAKEGATCCRAIMKELQAADIPVSAFPTDCTNENRYGYKVTERFPELACPAQPFQHSVTHLREILAKNTGLEIVATGNFRNLCGLLQSGPDEISPLNGTELIEKSVSRLYVMAGNFTHQTGVGYNGANRNDDGTYRPTAEYNVYCDGSAAAFVCANWPTKIVFLPFEVGADVISGKKIADKGENTPDGYAMIAHGSPLGRSSWDPMTALYAVYGGDPWAVLSENGTVSVDKNNITDFVPGQDGRHSFIRSLQIDNAAMADIIEQYL